MRIIQGHPKPVSEVQKTCYHCETVFAFTSRDVGPDNYVECPGCKRFNAVLSSDLAKLRPRTN